MAKTKINKSILKGVAAGFACVMCSAFFPAVAIADAADYVGDQIADSAISRIQVDGKNQAIKVKEGELVSVPAATYTYKNTAGDEATYAIGSGELVSENLTSSVKVTYKLNGDEVEVNEGKFRADRVGTYLITYTVEKDGTPYSYDLVVTSEASEATFNFKSNDENVIAKVYDPAYTTKDVVLPLPSVKQDDKEVVKTEDEVYFIKGTVPSGQQKYVEISLTNGAEGVEIEKDLTTGEFVIKGEDIATKSGEKYVYEGQEFKILYSYYQNVDGQPVFVASTSKTFTVKSNYFKNSQNKAGYTLKAEFASTFPTSATVGVAKELPSITATTSEKDSPAGEVVEVYYTIEALKMDENGAYTIDASSMIEDNKFTATEEGSYKFVYTITDFYGNEIEKTSNAIRNVKDTVSASVYMYDAADTTANDLTEKTFTSAENSLKSQTVNRNVIMYAIAGTDNMPSNEITLRREIRTYGGSTQYKIEEALYHGYNLVFAPKTLATTDGVSDLEVYKQISDDNYALRSQMIMADVDVTDGAEIKEYMLAHNYLLVTNTFNKDVNGNDIVDGLTEDAENALEQMIEAGYAYVAPQTGANAGFTADRTYTFWYFANDNRNKNAETKINKEVKFTADFSDEAVPTLTFANDLQSAYLPTDTFTFNVATPSDTTDGRISAVTAYRYLDEDKNAVAFPDGTETTTLNYVFGRTSETLTGDEWYVQGTDVAGETEVTSAGWYVEKNASSYKVDLNKKPAGANYVEIFSYAIDDYGNIGFFNKVVKISDTSDAQAPTLNKVLNAPNVGAKFTAPDEIELPTLEFSDNKVAFMNASVSVTRITRDASGEIESQEKISSYGMNMKPTTARKLYTVSGGYFRASVAGEYQVAITVVDGGSNSVTSFFTYEVEAGATEQNAPTIDNISNKNETVKPGQMYYLDPPSISIAKDADYGYIGLEEDDDSNTATYYTVEAIEATNNNYKIQNNLYFSSNSAGTYKLKYTAYLLQYKKAEVAQTKTANKLFFNAEGELKFYDGSEEYFVYMEENTAGDYEVVANTQLSGLGDALVDTSILRSMVSCHEIENDAVITLTVSAVSLSINEKTMDNHYKTKTEGYSVSKNNEPTANDYIEIIKPVVTENGQTNVNADTTYVTIKRNSSQLAKFKLSEWKEAEFTQSNYFYTEDGRIYLLFKEDGKYTITYDVEATVGTGDSYSVTLSAGDIQEPELELGKLVNKKLKIGDKDLAFTLKFDEDSADKFFTKLGDEKTSKQYLLESLNNGGVEIKYENEAYKTLENESTVEGEFNFTYALEKAGTYTVRITVEDEAGNETSKTYSFTVDSASSTRKNSNEKGWGIALITISCVLLAGVVAYFVVSKVKLDKKEKEYRRETKSKRK